MQLVTLAVALGVTLLVLRVLSRGNQHPPAWVIVVALIVGVAASAAISPIVTGSTYRESALALAMSIPLTVLVAALVWWKTGTLNDRDNKRYR